MINCHTQIETRMLYIKLYYVGMCIAAEMETCEVSTSTVNPRLSGNWLITLNAGN